MQYLRLDSGATARVDASDFPFASSTERDPGILLRPAVAHALAGPFCATIDLALLSLTLIYLALWASGEKIAGNLVELLSIRLSVGHFLEIALCWVVWRAIFYYCGLYTWQHVRRPAGVPGRVALAAGISALLAASMVGSIWHHGHAGPAAIFFWAAITGGALFSRAAICLFHLAVRPHFRRNCPNFPN